MAASGEDYCLKEIGGVFYREMAPVGAAVTDDLDLVIPAADWLTVGYNSEMRGQIPTGLYDRDKRVRNFLLDIDVSEQNPPPCVVQAFVGNSFNLQDPNDLDDVCAVQWADLRTRNLECQDGMKISEMSPPANIKNPHGYKLRPAKGMEWRCYAEGRVLYFKFIISNPKAADGSYPKAVGGDVCFSRIDFDVMALPKP